MGYLHNGVESDGLPIELVRVLQSNGENKMSTFIETGTAGGASVWQALFFFDNIHTIEIKEEVYNENRRRDEGNDRITHYMGDSVKILPEIIKQLDGSYALFFLDAHYSDSEPSGEGVKECPVIDEIRAISAYQNALIIIDDARLFLGPPPYPLDPRQWPSLWKVFYELSAAFVWHDINLRDDYILCTPTSFRQALDKDWADRFPIRYPSAEEKLRTEMRNSWKEFTRRFDDFKKYLDV